MPTVSLVSWISHFACSYSKRTPTFLLTMYVAPMPHAKFVAVSDSESDPKPEIVPDTLLSTYANPTFPKMRKLSIGY